MNDAKRELTVRKTPATDDSDNLLCGYMFIGYRGKHSGAIGLQRCPECSLENHAMSVATGTCAWCGWDIHESATITER